MLGTELDATSQKYAVTAATLTGWRENALPSNRQLDYGGLDLSKKSRAQRVLFILALLKEESS